MDFPSGIASLQLTTSFMEHSTSLGWQDTQLIKKSVAFDGNQPFIYSYMFIWTVPNTGPYSEPAEPFLHTYSLKYILIFHSDQNMGWTNWGEGGPSSNPGSGRGDFLFSRASGTTVEPS
jgi:hypothetical protein